MDKEKELKAKYGTDPGFGVPEGYFEQLQAEVMAKLPPLAAPPAQAPLKGWARMKPYVYLAAMFAGIWLMMGVFHRVADVSASFDNPPEHIASAMVERSEFEAFVPYESDYSVEREISSAYDDMAEFQADFGYEIKPEFASL